MIDSCNTLYRDTTEQGSGHGLGDVFQLNKYEYLKNAAAEPKDIF